MNREAIEAELVLPGEPLIYSIKYPVGKRVRGINFFRDMQWKSLLKCSFNSQYRTNVPVVIFVKFFVTPPDSVHISSKRLNSESVPAVQSFELADYLLSFLEMLHHVLINSYRQVVKIEMVKFYSAQPRTVFQFMKWDHYVNLHSYDTIQPESKSVSKNRKKRPLQSELPRDASDEGICEERSSTEIPTVPANERPSACDCPLSNTSTVKSTWKKTPSATYIPPHKKAGRRQPREVPK